MCIIKTKVHFQKYIKNINHPHSECHGAKRNMVYLLKNITIVAKLNINCYIANSNKFTCSNKVPCRRNCCVRGSFPIALSMGANMVNAALGSWRRVFQVSGSNDIVPLITLNRI